QTVRQEKSQIAPFHETGQDIEKLPFDSQVGEDLYLAHVDPYLTLEIPDMAVLREIAGIEPATERFEIHNPCRDAHYSVGFVNHRYHGAVLSFRGRDCPMITRERMHTRRGRPTETGGD